MRKLKAGIVGCGVIGSYLAGFLEREFSNKVSLAYLCDHNESRARRLKKKVKSGPRVVGLNELVRGSDFVIEAASPAAAAQVLEAAASRPVTVLMMSVGGFLKLGMPLAEFSRKFRGRLIVPSGAITGVDGLLAAREAGVLEVSLITRKPPAGLNEAPYFKTKKFPELRGKKEACVFRGTAAQAVAAFPQNINVAAVLSLAGLGFRRTRVELWTSRAYRVNSHEVRIRHKGGLLLTRAENLPSRENPKTSALALHAAAAALRRIFSNVLIGT
ncbi:MAG TPA: aspartate dehydrogenase domain-containing protein [Verrucomicrobiae bacterium]|jgi:aspartate dehydrogenase|nr:aspartate dehydrogenase domain-containing protein [Verrucomicrobiae bacterium]